MVNKKIVFWASLLPSLLIVILVVFLVSNICSNNKLCELGVSLLNVLGTTVFIFPCVLVFSLITYKMKEEIFKSWVRFVYWYVPVYIAYSIWVSGILNDTGDMSVLFSQGLTMLFILFLIFLFVLISIFIIVRKYIKLKI